MLHIAILAAAVAAQPVLPGEQPIELPYTVSDANAGATPYGDPGLLAAFHGQDGLRRIADDLVARLDADPRISDIFKGHDHVRLRRTLYEQFCYILGGGCAYTGRDMTAAHKDLGLQHADMNALVENLQAAMRKERVPFAAQNRLLAKLAPMRPQVIER